MKKKPFLLEIRAINPYKQFSATLGKLIAQRPVALIAAVTNSLSELLIYDYLKKNLKYEMKESLQTNFK